MDDLRYLDRADAGRRLATRIMHLVGERPVVLGLARGGVVVAAEVARALGAPLDVTVARKLGAPGHPEFGIGAIAPGGVRVVDWESARALGITEDAIARISEREEAVMDRRLAVYREGRLPQRIAGRTTILIDDGLATGVTALAALRALRREAPARLVFAVPVASPPGVELVEHEADEVVCLAAPADFRAVGRHYIDFDQTEDREVLDLLATADVRTHLL